MRLRPLVLTPGDPAGIGAEIAVKAWSAARVEGPVFAAIGAPGDFEKQTLALGLPRPIPIATIEEAPAAFAQGLPVLARAWPAPPRPGVPDPANAPAILAAIEDAVALTQSRRAAALVTNPIHKRSLYGAGFGFPGHTEFLAHLTQSPSPVMLLAIEGLRVVPVTVHLPVAEAVARLTTSAIVQAGIVTARELTAKFGVAAPRLAVAALNPHAGEDGALGTQERDIIAPAVAQLRAQGVGAFGPAPLDTLFHPAARARYDAALCMLHDHALLPLKTLDFDRGVNVTLGLPIIRTSPDHGTAFDIAGQGVAKPDSLLAALRMAAALAERSAP